MDIISMSLTVFHWTTGEKLAAKDVIGEPVAFVAIQGLMLSPKRLTW
jgi:hypothetical protein